MNRHTRRSRLPGPIFSVLILLTLAPAVSLAQVPLDLAEVFRRVEEANPLVLRQRALVADQIAQQRGSLGDLLPQFSIAGSQTRGKNANVSGFAESFPSQISNRFGIGLEARLDVLDPTNLTNYLLQRAQTEVALLDEAAFVQDQLLNAGTAYFDFLRDRARLEVIEANIERDETLLEQAQTQFDAGVATRIDVTRAEVTLANDQRDLLEQEQAVYTSELRLKVLLDLPMEQEIVVEPLQAVVSAPVEEQPWDIETLLQLRPDYQREVENLRVNEVAKTAAVAQRLPALSIFGSYGYAEETVFDTDYQEEWQIGVSLSMPIWEGGRISADVQRSKALLRAQERVIDNLRNEVAQEYLVAMNRVRTRFAQIDLAEKAVDLSEQELELARTRFSEGVADNRDVVEAQAGLAAAEDSLVEAIYQYQLSRLTLAEAKGNIRLVVDE